MLCDTNRHGYEKRRPWLIQFQLMFTFSLNFVFLAVVNISPYFMHDLSNELLRHHKGRRHPIDGVKEMDRVNTLFTLGSSSDNQKSHHEHLLNQNFLHIATILIHIFSCLLVMNLLRVSSDPGFFKNIDLEMPLVPVDTIEEKRSQLDSSFQRSFDRWVRARYWYECWNIKPPRAHHCRRWNRCVLKMDHHWRWMSNCIGLLNHKFFLLVLLYYFLTVNLSLAISVYFVIWFELRYALALSLLQILILCHIWLAIYRQSQGVLHNLTVIERLERDKSPFDFGYLQNLTAIMGTNRWAWLLPIKPKLDTKGFYYDINLSYFTEDSL